MYVGFDGYPPYNYAISHIFGAKINSCIKFCRVYSYSTPKGIMITWINNKSWEILKLCFPESLTVKKCPKRAVFYSCKYADGLRAQINEILYFLPE